MSKPVDFKKFHSLQLVEIQHRPHLTLVMCSINILHKLFLLFTHGMIVFLSLRKVLMAFDKRGIKKQIRFDHPYQNKR